MPGSHDERVHPATDRRRAEARARGEVARSGELASALMVGGCLCLLLWQGPQLVTDCAGWLATSLSQPACLRAEQLMEHSSGAALAALFTRVTCLLGGLWLLSVVTRLVQTGPQWTPDRVLPRWERIHPGNGLRRIVSSDSVAQVGLWVFKLAAVFGVIGWKASAALGRLEGLTSLSPEALALQLGSLMADIAVPLCGVLIALGLLDYGWQRWQHERQLQMTDDELRAEQRDLARLATSRSPRRQPVAAPKRTDGVRTA